MTFNFYVHPVIRIISLLMLAVVAQQVGVRGLLALLLVLLLWVWQSGWRDALRLFRRARWLLVSLLLIYAFATPGELVPGWPEWIAPTYEGLRSGLTQALRLIVMLMALAELLASGGRETWISGIYALIQPLAVFGISAECFAVRLWLTLHYVEHAPSGMVKTLRQHHWNLDVLLDHQEPGPAQIQLVRRMLQPLDYLVMLGWFMMLWWLR
jgi:energy-coupling factor transport system permease protein